MKIHSSKATPSANIEKTMLTLIACQKMHKITIIVKPRHAKTADTDRSLKPKTLIKPNRPSSMISWVGFLYLKL